MKKAVVLFFSCLFSILAVNAQTDSVSVKKDTALSLKKNWLAVGFSPFYVNLADHMEADPKVILSYKRRGDNLSLRLGLEMENYRDHDGIYREHYDGGVPAHLIGDTVVLRDRYLGQYNENLNVRIGVEKNWLGSHTNIYAGVDLILGASKEQIIDYTNTEYFVVETDTVLYPALPFDRVVDHTINRYWTFGVAPVVGCEFYINNWLGGALQYSPRVAYQVGNYSLNSVGLSDLDYNADFRWKNLTDHHFDFNWGYLEAFLFISF